MKKSKHFRKDVILARVIAALILIVLISLICFGISLLSKSSGDDKNSQSSQNTEHTQDFNSEYQNLNNDDTQNEEVETPVIDTSESESTESESEDKIYVKTTTQVKLRKEPNTNCATLDRIDGGTKLEVLETLDGWYKVIYDGKEGYVSATYAKIVEE